MTTWRAILRDAPRLAAALVALRALALRWRARRLLEHVLERTPAPPP